MLNRTDLRNYPINDFEGQSELDVVNNEEYGHSKCDWVAFLECEERAQDEEKR